MKFWLSCIGAIIIAFAALAMRPTDEVSLNCYYLTTNPWKFNSKLETTAGDGEWTIKPETTLPCEEDDIISFSRTEHCNMGTYEITSGNVKCKEKADVLRSGNWSLSTNGRYLKMDEYELSVVKLNKDTFQVIRGPGIYKDRYTFIH